MALDATDEQLLLGVTAQRWHISTLVFPIKMCVEEYIN